MTMRESLTARYRRVLGRALPDVDPDDLPTEGTVGRGSASRRREQVLQAQRTHRHRTQQYIRELEKEVLRLRDENDKLQKSMKQMQQEKSQTSRISAQTNLPAPNFHNHAERQHQPVYNLPLDTTKPQDSSSMVIVDLTSLASASPQGSCDTHPAELTPPIYQPATPNFFPRPPTRPLNPPNHTANILSNQLGITFILTLEKPCLPHVKAAHMSQTPVTTPEEITYNSGPGHLLNISATLTHRYHEQVNLETQELSLPNLEIETLLESAGRLRLEGEITPVQIWERVRREVQNGASVTREDVERLLEVLKRYIYCNSFGSVVQTRTAELVLVEWLRSSRS